TCQAVSSLTRISSRLPSPLRGRGVGGEGAAQGNARPLTPTLSPGGGRASEASQYFAISPRSAAPPASLFTCAAAPSSIIFSSLVMAQNCQPSAMRRLTSSAEPQCKPGATLCFLQVARMWAIACLVASALGG